MPSGKGGGGGLLFFANLTRNVDWRRLKEHCQSRGVHLRRVETFDAHNPGRPVRLAVAQLVDDRELQTAIRALNESILDERVMIVREDRRDLIKSPGDNRTGPTAAGHMGNQRAVHPGGLCGLETTGTLEPWRSRALGEETSCAPWRQRDWHNCGWPDAKSGCDSFGGDLGSSDLGVRERSPIRGDRGGCSAEISDGQRAKSGKGGFCRHGFRQRWMPARPLTSQPRQPQGLETPRALWDRRLFAEELPTGMDWKVLKDLFLGRFKVLYTDVVHVTKDRVYGIIKFQSRTDALEACLQFNGVLPGKEALGEKAIRLGQDQGDFDMLKAIPPTLELWGPGRKARVYDGDFGEDEEEEM